MPRFELPKSHEIPRALFDFLRLFASDVWFLHKIVAHHVSGASISPQLRTWRIFAEKGQL